MRPPALPAALASRLDSLPALLRTRLFLMCVVVPTALAVLYFGFIASDVYVSESSFIVRNQEDTPQSSLGSLLHGTGLSTTDSTTSAVQTYILSRDALSVLDSELHLGKSFASHNIDFFSRFARLPWHSSFEHLLLYYRDKVSVGSDNSASIVSISIRAFTAADTYAVDRRLLELTEARINKLNEDARQDTIRYAAAEVADAEAREDAATAVLARYRAQKNVMDPEKQSAVQLELVAKLEDELVATQALIAQVDKLASSNPQLPALRQQALFLQKAIDAETARIVGGPSGSLASKAQEYSRLSVQKEVAGTILAGAIAALETARNEARRKVVYFERIAQPSKPDVAMEPHRLRSIAATLLLGLIFWGVMSLLVVAVKEHRH
jgi:capsular polysaccharide transport system permease protein